jgi:hypothetical protein
MTYLLEEDFVVPARLLYHFTDEELYVPRDDEEDYWPQIEVAA